MIKRLSIVGLSVISIIFIPYYIVKLGDYIWPSPKDYSISILQTWMIGAFILLFLLMLSTLIVYIVIPAIRDLINWIKHG